MSRVAQQLYLIIYIIHEMTACMVQENDSSPVKLPPSISISPLQQTSYLMDLMANVSMFAL